MISFEELRSDVQTGAIDTVVAAFTDMQGRLMSKRLQAESFLEDAVNHGIEGCNYLLAAYESDAEPFPHSLREAIAALEGGAVTRQAPGDAVVDHYINYACTEQRLFDEVVTCYERERMFERG